MNLISELKEGLGISWAAIRANKLRSVLTTLGIVIGVVTVTLMGTAIEGLNRAFVNSISFIGADVLYVQRVQWFIDSREEWERVQKRERITLEQARALAEQLAIARAVAPVAESRAPIQYQKRSSGAVPILGTTDQYAATSGLTLAEGRHFSPGESAGGRPVCVVGANVATNLFRGDSALGKRVAIAGKQFEVIGVLEKRGGLFGEGGLDNQVLIPLPQFTANFIRRPDYMIQVKVSQVTELEDAKEELRAVMRRIREVPPGEPDDFAINQQDQVLSMFHKVAGTIAAVGLFITGLSLFVGGIGIMNIMFVSVAERTREIGIRKALGAKRRTILLQFLMEAAGICLIGGVVALAIAWPITLLMQKIMPAMLSAKVVGIALAVSLVTGIVSGFIPAWRAARMNPVDALRNE